MIILSFVPTFVGLTFESSFFYVTWLDSKLFALDFLLSMKIETTQLF